VIDSPPGAREGLGLFASARRMLATLIELVYTRLELVGVELEAGVQRAASLLLWSIAAIFCATLAILLLALTVLIAFWDTHRLLAAASITGFFIIAGAAAALVVRHRVRTRPRLLASTIDELRRDAAALDGAQR